MTWLRRLFVGLSSMVLSLAMLLAGALLVLNDDDYRTALVWTARTFLDARLQINGPLGLHLAREAWLSAGKVSLIANDGRYSLAVGEFQTRVRLDSLLHGILWVKSLLLDDVHLEIRQAADSGGFDFHGISFPTFVIEEARLHNLFFDYHESRPDKTHKFALLGLVIAGVNNSDPVDIEGNGYFENRNFSIKGRMDSLVQLVDAKQPYAVHLDVTSGTLRTRLDGTIARPLAGAGLDLELSLNDPDISKTLRLWNDRAPALGTLAAQMRLRGDYAKPRLEQISARLQRPGELNLNVTGEIENLRTLGNMDLRVDAVSSNPSVTSWLLFDRRNKLRSLAVKATVHAGQGQYRIGDLQAQARTRSGVQVDVSGSADIHKTLRKRPVQARELQLAIDSPTTKALTTVLTRSDDSIPELGRIRMTAGLIPCMDGVSLNGLNLVIGGPGQIRTTVTGSIETIPFSRPAEPSGFNLAVDTQAAKSTYLNKYLNLELPDLGEVRARARVRGRVADISIESLKLAVGPPDQPVLRADGTIRTGFRRGSSTLDIGFDAATARLIAVLSSRAPPASLGRLTGSMTVSDVDGRWGVDKFTMVSAHTSLFQFKASGALGDLVDRDQGHIRTMLVIDDVPALGSALGVDLAGFSPYRGQGRLEINKGRLNYEASNTLGSTTSTTRLTGSLIGNRPRLQGRLDIPVLNLADFGVGRHAAGGKPAGVAAQTAGKNYLFSRRPFDLSILQALDLDMTVVASVVKGTRLSLERLDGRINLRDGVLRASPVRLEFQGGPSTVDLQINARTKPVFNLKVSGNDLSLGPVLAQIQNEVPVEGYANLKIDVGGSGDSLHEVVSSLDGKFSFGLEDARVPRKYVDYLALDVFGWVLNTATRRDPYAKLNCVMAAFDIEDGVATSNLLAADGPALDISGTATVNFKNETMDITLLPRQKKTLFSELAPVHIKGPWPNPEVTALPIKSAVTSLGPLMLTPAFPMLAIPAILAEKLWTSLHAHGERHGGCTRLVKKIEKRKEKERSD
jgi:hypothetical protein